MTEAVRRPPLAARALALLLAAGLMAAPVQAQTPLAVSVLRIELWPEYDRPAVLVILTGTLAPEVALPATLTVHIPAAAGGPHAVAVADAQGALTEAPYTTTVEGDLAVISLQASSVTFHIEYYDPALAISGEARAYTFKWTPDFAVADATLQVQEPVGAQALTGVPALTPLGAGSLGLNYSGELLGALTAGQAVSLQLSYTKSSAALSADMVAQSRVTQAAQATQLAQASSVTVEPNTAPAAFPGLGLALAGVAALGLVAFGVWRLRAAARTAAPTRSRPAVDHAAARFCTQCGRQAHASDTFCRGCGAHLPAA